jgi:hypothetical protein
VSHLGCPALAAASACDVTVPATILAHGRVVLFLHPPRDNFAITMTDEERAAFAAHASGWGGRWPTGAALAGPTLHLEATQSSHKRIASDALGMLHQSTPGCQPASP